MFFEMYIYSLKLVVLNWYYKYQERSVLISECSGVAKGVAARKSLVTIGVSYCLMGWAAPSIELKFDTMFFIGWLIYQQFVYIAV